MLLMNTARILIFLIYEQNGITTWFTFTMMHSKTYEWAQKKKAGTTDLAIKHETGRE